MIICVSGTPGAGKTYDITKKIMDNLRLGRTVYTNIDGFDSPEIREAQKAYCGLDDWDYESRMIYLSKDESRTFWRVCKPGSLIVIDEIHMFFNSRDWASAENREFVDWASTHRHHGYDLIMITQALEKVDKQARSLVEWTYFYRKVNYFGSFVKNKFQMFSYIGDDDRGKAFAQKIKTYDSRVFKCYKSYITEDVKEQGFMKHVNILKHPVFFAVPIMIALCIYMIFWKSSIGTGDLFGYKKATAVNTKAAADRNKALSSKAVVNKPKIVELRDLAGADGGKKNVIESAKKAVMGSFSVGDVDADIVHPVVSACRLSGTVVVGDDTIEQLECPDGSRIKKKNGVVVYEHKKRTVVDSRLGAKSAAVVPRHK